MKTNIILKGDALTQLKTLPENSINMCMTSPPYWALRDYGVEGQLGLEQTFNKYISNLCDIFGEVKRVLRDDGTCWINLGDTYSAHKDCKSVAQTITKGTKNEKAHIIEKGKSVSRNSKLLKEQGMPDKCLIMIPFRFAIEMVNRGWILRNTIIWHKPNCMPFSGLDRFTVDFEYLFFFSKNKKYNFNQQTEPSINKESYEGRKPRNAGSMAKVDLKNYAKAGSINLDGTLKGTGKKYPNRNKRAVWKISPKSFKEAHFATYPEKLCESPIDAGCPEGGIVLDPFFGAGTTGLVALKQGKKFIGIELNPEYIEIAKKRLKPFLEQKTLK